MFRNFHKQFSFQSHQQQYHSMEMFAEIFKDLGSIPWSVVSILLELVVLKSMVSLDSKLWQQ